MFPLSHPVLHLLRHAQGKPIVGSPFTCQICGSYAGFWLGLPKCENRRNSELGPLSATVRSLASWCSFCTSDNTYFETLVNSRRKEAQDLDSDLGQSMSDVIEYDNIAIAHSQKFTDKQNPKRSQIIFKDLLLVQSQKFD